MNIEKEYRVICPYCHEALRIITVTNFCEQIKNKEEPTIECPNCDKFIELTSENCDLLSD